MTPKPEVFDPIPFRLDPVEVRRLLGYVPGRRLPSPAVQLRIDDMIAESQGLLRPKGAFVVKPLATVPAFGPFRGAQRIAYSVSTIGPKLEERSAELALRGETLRALALDAVGSAAVEAATDVLNALICEQIGQKELFSNRRISPGYRGWPIEGQREIFELIPSEVTGVVLRPTYFMSPRKSISAGISIGKGVPHSKYVSICAYCPLLDCAFRRREEAFSERPHT